MLLSTIVKKLQFLALGAGMKSQYGTNRIKPNAVPLPVLYVALPRDGISWPCSQQFHNWETRDTKPSPSLSHCSCLLQSLHNFGTLWALNCIPVINPIEHTLGEGKGTPKMCFSLRSNAVLTIGEALEAIAGVSRWFQCTIYCLLPLGGLTLLHYLWQLWHCVCF